MKKWLVLFLFGSSMLAGATASAFKYPELTGPVMDEAHLLSPGMQNQLTQILRQVFQSGKAQIQIFTFDSLDGASIEEVSIGLTDKWKLGTAKKDNGVLFLIAKKEHKIRIEVGQGLEGDLPDIYAGRIIRQVVSPLFKEGHFDEGILQGTFLIIQKVAPEFATETRELAKTNTSHRSDKKGLPVLVIFIFIIFILARLGVFPFFLFGGFGDGGGRWRGGGGGGWSGGGGGFSGGGASGDW